MQNTITRPDYTANGSEYQLVIPIARFRSGRLGEAIEDLFGQLVVQLKDAGELSLSNLFVDGTKVEANAGRYTFVWKKSMCKHEARMQERMKAGLPGLAKGLGISPAKINATLIAFPQQIK